MGEGKVREKHLSLPGRLLHTAVQAKLHSTPRGAVHLGSAVNVGSRAVQSGDPAHPALKFVCENRRSQSAFVFN